MSDLRHPSWICQRTASSLPAEWLRPREDTYHRILVSFSPCNAHRANVKISHSREARCPSSPALPRFSTYVHSAYSDPGANGETPSWKICGSWASANPSPPLPLCPAAGQRGKGGGVSSWMMTWQQTYHKEFKEKHGVCFSMYKF